MWLIEYYVTVGPNPVESKTYLTQFCHPKMVNDGTMASSRIDETSYAMPLLVSLPVIVF